MPWALWGFSRGVRQGEVGTNCPPPSLCLAGWVLVTRGTTEVGIAEQDWRCDCGAVYPLAVSGSEIGFGGRDRSREKTHV